MNRRIMIQGTLASAAALSAARAFAAIPDRDLKALKQAVDAGFDSALRRIQEWIACRPSPPSSSTSSRAPTTWPGSRPRPASAACARCRPAASRRVRRARCRREAHRRPLFHVRREAVRPGRMDLAAAGRRASSTSRARQARMRGRGAVNQKGPEGAFLAALHAVQGGRPQAAGQPRAGRRRARRRSARRISTASCDDPRCSRRTAARDGVFMPVGLAGRRRRRRDQPRRQGRHRDASWSRAARSWGRGPKHDIHSSLKAQVDSPVWHLVEALHTLVTADGNTPAIDGWFEHVRPLTPRERELIAEPARHAQRGRRSKQSLGVEHWIDDLPWRAIARAADLAADGQHRGPGRRLYRARAARPILPHRAVAKLDLRLVPDMTVDGRACAKLQGAPRQARLRRHRGQHDAAATTRPRPPRTRR